MLLRTRTAFSVLAFLLLAAACGSSSGSSSGSPSDGDGGVETSTGSTGTCGSPFATCSTEGECCTANVPDGFGAEGFRCTSSAWRSDSTCLPPPTPCASPLTGSLTRGDGSSVSPTCFQQLGIVGVAAASVVVEPGGLLELYFDRLPAAGDVVPVYPYAERSAHALDAGAADGGDAGAPNAVTMRIGRAGGFAGFSVEAESASGNVTVTSIQTNATGISALHVTLDAQMTVASGASSPWSGKLTGSW